VGIKVLSICGGIETGLLALQELGIQIDEYHTYEILPEAIAVSSYHFPWIVHHGNVIRADFSQFKDFDLVIAGTCCQSLS
jgi:DNA (cytosine-5)-methyltransferase 3A